MLNEQPGHESMMVTMTGLAPGLHCVCARTIPQTVGDPGCHTPRSAGLLLIQRRGARGTRRRHSEARKPHRGGRVAGDAHACAAAGLRQPRDHRVVAGDGANGAARVERAVAAAAISGRPALRAPAMSMTTRREAATIICSLPD